MSTPCLNAPRLRAPVRSRRAGRRQRLARARTVAGITLVEVLVVIAIAAVLLAVAVPSMQSMLQANRVDTAANQFVAMLAMARSEAVKQGGRVLVASGTAGTDWGTSGWSVCSVPAGATACSGAGAVAVQQVTALTPPMTIVGTASYLSFDSTGRLLGSVPEVDFIVCGDGSTATKPLAAGITVLASGRVRVSTYDSAGVPVQNDGTTEMTCTVP